ncbi:uncharacterized protein LOC127508813 [Ctenopharyngodon idella]|uniref:uncharacterized protein LOC127508813 n=1 Tax=Ctenopharyngodon idella TaxID=7959 RepID=UPI00222F93BE|nr:uncharacterized protein LOC127508813 [Ctenopharyngodon idella]
MFVPALLTCVVLGAFSAQAKVVTSFNECSEFFYKNTEPVGMNPAAKKICQKLEFGGPYYVSLYSVVHRIPLYSAYTLDPECSSTAGRTENWHVEPQISQPESQTDYMVQEKDSDGNMTKRYQAISSDYRDTGYDRGHLNPNTFHCKEGHKATFTLTNAAPIDAGFNRIHWKNWESMLRSFLKSRLESDGGSATAFIVTGTVPDANLQIPQREISEEPERVTVPSHIWMAVCYKHHSDDTKSFSFGYIGENKPEGGISLMRVSDLNDELSRLYSELSMTHQSINIFVGDCFGENDKLNEVQGMFDKLINLPVNQGDLMATDVQNMSRTKRAIGSSQHSYFTVGGYSCRYNHPCGKYGEDYYWCWIGYGYFFDSWDYCSPPLLESKAKNGEYCQSNYACNKYGSGYRWCYTLTGNHDMCCTYDSCFAAVNDKTCWSDHPCGYHGYSYLWCYIDDEANWDYCCKDCGQ